jgi:hypothetical protein
LADACVDECAQRPAATLLGWTFSVGVQDDAATSEAEQPQRRFTACDTIALSAECSAAETAQCAVRAPIVDVGDVLKPGAEALIRRTEEKLREDELDARREGDVPPTPAASEACRELSRRLAPHVALAPRLRWGVFTEDDGGISLAVQSLVTDRRIDCRIAPDASLISAIRVDERMHVDTIGVSLASRDIGRELGEWVTKRS